MLSSMPVELVPVAQLRPTEQHHPEHAADVAAALLEEQLWRVPITLERESLAIMDGHHRVEAARRLRLAYVPCLLLDYSQVQVVASRDDYDVTPQEIVRRAASGELYPPKTTRHCFGAPLPRCNISVSLLRGAVA